MKNILYVSFLNEDIRPGYKIKIHSQCKAFANLGWNSFLFIENKDGFVLYTFNKGESVLCSYQDYKRKLENERNILDEAFLFSIFCKRLLIIIDNYDIEYIYMRRIVPITPKLIGLLRKLKKRDIPVIYEYPTLPWENEMKVKKTIVRKLFYVMDKVQYNRLIKMVSKITYIGRYEGNNSKFIQIQNGGFAENYPCVNHNQTNEDFIMIGVSQINRVNGYDLIIDALHEYYKNNPSRKIYFYLVGNMMSDTLRIELESKVQEFSLDQYVKFFGLKTGEELNEIYNKASVAINSLKLEEMAGMDTSIGVATLKTVDYTFRGLPQVATAPLMINGKDADKPEFLYIVKDKYNIDLNNIVEFIDSLEMSSEEIRKYAINHMSWDIILKRVLDTVL